MLKTVIENGDNCKTFMFPDIVESLFIGELKDGTTFLSGNGTITVHDNALYHLTESGYRGTVVGVTPEMFSVTWIQVVPCTEREVTFSEAVKELADGTPITLRTEHDEYTFTKADNLREYIETLSNEELVEIVNAKCTVLEELDTGTSVTSPRTQGARITDEDAYDILVANKHHGNSVQELSDEYGISVRMVYYILDGTCWNHVYKRYLAESGVH